MSLLCVDMLKTVIPSKEIESLIVKMDILGKGSFGTVYARNGLACKEFKSFNHMIHEYVIMKYIEECPYFVKVLDIDMNKLSIYMEIYDDNLKIALKNQMLISTKNMDKTIKSILFAMIYLHERDIIHGDIKLKNILVKLNPFDVVLADFGLTNISKYAKIWSTTPIYREKNPTKNYSHDIYSFGICLLELIAGVLLKKQLEYSALKKIVDARIYDSSYKTVILACLSEVKEQRPSAIKIFKHLYPQEQIPDGLIFTRKYIFNLHSENHQRIRAELKLAQENFKTKRCKMGFCALSNFIKNNNISESEHPKYIKSTIFILMFLFSELVDIGDIESLSSSVKNLIEDKNFIRTLFSAYQKTPVS